jgi:alkylated DNA repair protein (DNA oxidative demethylase)
MAKLPSPLPRGLYYKPYFLNRQQRQIALDWLSQLHPLWEMRFSEHNPPPPGDTQRRLKRPVYWLGNWQFACLDYFHPPKGLYDRCIEAEPFPLWLQEAVARIEFIAKSQFPKSYIPPGWHLNTCLVNFYGTSWEESRKIDQAQVGEHKDFEPGPVGSLSFGERAFFQFVEGQSKLGEKNIVQSQWLEDSSLQIFAGPIWKDRYFHRVQRVEEKNDWGQLGPVLENFKTRRINLTLRYVPLEYVKNWKNLPAEKQADTKDYVVKLAEHSPFYKKLITLDKFS